MCFGSVTPNSRIALKVLGAKRKKSRRKREKEREKYRLKRTTRQTLR